MGKVSGRAYAKVNLALRVLGRRPDGFHELRTVYQTVGLYDSLEIEFRPGAKLRIDVRCNIAELQSERNLAVTAARRLLDAAEVAGELALALTKRIPSGAGLGGGSSDAAAALLGLNALLPRPLPGPRLHEIAAETGSDVPFFLLGGKAFGFGRGEEICPLPEGPGRWLLLLAPHLQVGTPQAYRELAEARRKGLTPDRKSPILSVFTAGIGAPGDCAAQSHAEVLENDFESVIFGRHPELAELKARLLRSGAPRALMSGSGSALFGLFEDRGSALAAQKRLGEFDGESYVVSTVSRRRCRSGWRVERE